LPGDPSGMLGRLRGGPGLRRRPRDEDRARSAVYQRGHLRHPVLSMINTMVQEAQERLDAHVREIIEWHFNPATGCPFWLDFASKLSWEPRKQIHCFADLRKFPPFEDDWLRGGPVRRWAPKGLAGKPMFVF